MNRLVTSFFLGIMISGCGGADTGAGTGTAENDCEDAHGIDAHIWYGDSHLKVSHKTTVKQEEAVLFKLHPDPNSDENVDYDEVTVHIVGKKPKDDWLNTSFKASDTEKKRTVCVLMQEVGEYEYFVKVEKVGTIDPRVKVEPK
jgi:hypothetical protein